MTNTIQGIPAPSPAVPISGSSPGVGEEGSFYDTLQGAMSQVQELHSDAQGKVAGMLDGTGEDVHSAMIAVEKAGLAFEMMVQVRNKIVQAYQTVSQMQF
jgi:flagellar hook-basal body complex protein FliE